VKLSVGREVEVARCRAADVSTAVVVGNVVIVQLKVHRYRVRGQFFEQNRLGACSMHVSLGTLAPEFFMLVATALGWPKKIKVGNTFLHNAAPVTLQNARMHAKFWTD